MMPARDIPDEVFSGAARKVVPQGRRLGLVVGIDQYQDPGIPNLTAAVADAKAIYDAMVDPECGLFVPEDTVLLTNELATERNLKREMERLAEVATGNDEVWVFFAGHAIIKDNLHRLLPADSERKYLEASSVPSDTQRKIRCRRRVVFLDCCHAGATDISTRDIHDVEEVVKSYDADGVITFCSSDGAEQSVELPEMKRGLFSYWLERGMRGEADLDGDGVVNSNELRDYVQKHVTEGARKLGREQNPRYKEDTSGAFALSINLKAIKDRQAVKQAEQEELQLLKTLCGPQDHQLDKSELRRASDYLMSEDRGFAGVKQDIKAELASYKENRNNDGAREAKNIRRILEEAEARRRSASVTLAPAPPQAPPRQTADAVEPRRVPFGQAISESDGSSRKTIFMAAGVAACLALAAVGFWAYSSMTATKPQPPVTKADPGKSAVTPAIDTSAPKSTGETAAATKQAKTQSAEEAAPESTNRAAPPKVPADPLTNPALTAAATPAKNLPPTVRVNPKDLLKYVSIPSGVFQMGCSPGDGECTSAEKPAHPVTITKAFWLGQTAVTQAAYQRVTGTNPAPFKGANFPVVQVTWTEAQAYCTAIGGRLPTEAEWEYAARAGTTTPYYAPLDAIAWYVANSGDKPHEVGQKQPNAWNLYDMLGNVRQWTADWFAGGYYANNADRDPTGPQTQQRSRAIRGSAWSQPAEPSRVSFRDGHPPDARAIRVGFRCVGQ